MQINSDRTTEDPHISQRKISIKSYLTLFIFLCGLPLALLTIYLGVSQVRTARNLLYRQATNNANNAALLLDLELKSKIGALEALATSGALDDPIRLDEFQEEAEAFQKVFANRVILADPSMQVIVDSRRPLKEPPLKLSSATAQSVAEVALESRKPSVGSFVVDSELQEPVIEIAVRVIRGGEVRYVLIGILSATEFQKNLNDISVTQERILTVLDDRNQVIARRISLPEGHPAYSGSASFRRFAVKSKLANWTVVYEMPVSVYNAPLVHALIAVLGMFLIAAIIMFVAGRKVAVRIFDSVSELAGTQAAKRSRWAFTEIEDVRVRLAEANEARDNAIAELQQTESMLRTVLKKIPSGVAVRDAGTGNVVVANERAEEILGGLFETPEHFDGCRGVHTDGRKYEREEWPISRTIATGETVDSEEIRCERKDGTPIVISVSSAPIRNESGRIVMAVSVFHDITLMKKTQEALVEQQENIQKLVEERTASLEESQKLLKTIIDNLPVAITYTDTNNRYVFSNKTHQTWWAKPPEQIIGLTAQDLMGEKYSKAEPNLKSALDGQEMTREMSFEYGDGKVRDIWLRIVPDRAASGEIRGSIHLAIDLSDLKRAQKELRKSEIRYKELAELLPQPVWELNSSGKFAYGNAALLKMAQVSLSDFLSFSDPVAMFIPENRPAIVKGIERVLGGERVVLEDLTFLQKDGNTIPCMAFGDPIYNDDRIEGIRGVLVDLSPLRKAQEERDILRDRLFQSEKLASLGTLVGGMAHDFNNMLQIISGYCEILTDQTPVGTSAYDSLEKILDTSEEAARLISKLLAYGQQAQLIPKPADLNDAINGITKWIKQALPKITTIEVDLLEGPAIIGLDVSYIDQLLMSLAINASEAMPDGGRLRISTIKVELDGTVRKSHPEANPGEYILLTFTDTGRGMDKETLSRAFDPFFSTKPRGNIKGMGLGLSVVRGMVQQHGGFVTCTSELGIGTEFKLYFPAVDAPQPAVATVSQDTDSQATETVLLAEDVAFVAELERAFLENEGYKVLLASNGLEALSLYRERKDEISLVILDLLMPVMSGQECLTELLKINPAVKALIVSGYSSEDELARQVAPYVKDFLKKPCSKAEFLKGVRKAIDG